MRTGKEYHCNTCGRLVYRSVTKAQHSKSSKYFCSKSCQTVWRNRYFSGAKHSNWIDGQGSYRALSSRNGFRKLCSRCQNKDERVLAVHHLDRNQKNNTLTNLVWLCHNCHFLIHCDNLEEQRFMETLV